jgi:hypothetical protein
MQSSSFRPLGGLGLSPKGDDFLFYGHVVGFESEWGYFTLRELENVNISGMVIERDSSFKPDRLSTWLSELNLQ